MKKTTQLVLAAVIALVGLNGIFADAKGKEIMDKVNALPQGSTRTMSSTMAIIPKGGKPEIKEFSIISKKSGNITRSLSTFTKPTRLQFLSWSGGGESSQWIKLSSGSVRRVASSDKGGKFVGSDFYYEDLGDNDSKDFEYTYKGDVTVDGIFCYVVQGVKIHGTSTYTKVLIYVGKSDYFIRQVEMFEKQGHTKTLHNERIEKIQGVLIPRKVTMERTDGSSKTIIYIRNVVLDKPISDSYFSKESL